MAANLRIDGKRHGCAATVCMLFGCFIAAVAGSQKYLA